jgi:hypothetical protein
VDLNKKYSLKDIKKAMFLPVKRLSLVSVILLYLTLLQYLSDMVWPLIFYPFVIVLRLYEILNPSFLLLFVAGFGVIISYIGTLILISGCLSHMGGYFFDNPALHPYEEVVASNIVSFIKLLTYYTIFCTVMLLLYIGYEGHGGIFFQESGINDAIYTMFATGNFTDYASRCVVYWPVTLPNIKLNLLTFIFIFVIGYHVLTPRALIVGFQSHIWKIRFEKN